MGKERGEIIVSGTGRVRVKPDVADLRLGVSLSRDSVAELREEAARIMADVIASIQANGVPQSDVQTHLVSVQPRYAYHDNEPPRAAGFELTNVVEVSVRDLSRLTDVIDSALKAGATSLDGLSFRLADPTPAETQARSRAMAEARSHADVLAEAARLSITGVVAIVEEGSMPPPRPFAKTERMMMATDHATPVESGSLEVAVHVTVTYRTTV